MMAMLINACMPDLSETDVLFIGVNGGSSNHLSVEAGSNAPWHVELTKDRVTVLDGSLGGPTPVDPTRTLPGALDPAVVKVSSVGQSLMECLSRYTFVKDAPMPTTPSGLLQLYRYDVAVLWPCLKQHGAPVGKPPTRDQFTSADNAWSAMPYNPTRQLTRKTFAALADASRYCPEVPEYLTNPGARGE